MFRFKSFRLISNIIICPYQLNFNHRDPTRTNKFPRSSSPMSKISPTFRQIHFHTFFIFLLTFSRHAASRVHDQEQTILLKLKQHWQSPPSINHWTQSNSSHCSWPEITCTNGSITGIFLRNGNISGTIPPFICQLNNLKSIDLSLNYITGNFPTVLYNCSNLQYLDLSKNFFNGTIPDDIDAMAQLWYLNVGSNFFSGDIPKAIGRFPMLQTLYLFQNQLNGSSLPEIGNLSNLEVLGLAYNDFVPSGIPANFTQLKNLKWLWMAGTHLIGEIPKRIGDMMALEHLDLSVNNLRGKIPTSLFRLKKLTALILFNNELSGEIPRAVEALNLSSMDLSQNKLSGTIPDDFGKLLNLTGLILYNNQLSGKIPESIGRIPGLKDVRIFSNNLSGLLPPDFGRLSKLEGFQIASNRFTGRLPEHLCAGGMLRGVIAFDNNLSGELPKSLGNCTSLEFLRVHGNKFCGKIPSGLWSSGSNLQHLMISDNLFTGELPNDLALNLSRLEISNNQFSGEIPAGISSLKNLVVFKACNNLFTGPIPGELTALSSLTKLFLDRNQLSGHLPSDHIMSWKWLTNLNLSRNKLSGPIPEEIGFLPVLTDLDLSENEFSGQIPLQLSRLKFTSLNLSSNHLTGRIPIEFENKAYSSSFLNNPGLCASESYVGLSICNSQTQNSRKVSIRFLSVISSIVGTISITALLFAVIMIKVYRRGNHHGLMKSASWKLTQFQRTLNFTESNIVESLTEDNEIGSGRSGKVYRVAVNSSGELVAVKKIWNDGKLEQKLLEKEFEAEVEILGLIRHCNIVKLLCCISSENSKLLVYEYLENHSLDRWLHAQKRPLSLANHVVLDWPKRLKIAVGAAQGLCYMHHSCSPPIIHRDVKSGNILLDSEFNAKIADFGLTKVLIKLGEAKNMSTVAGSFGYIAPEYGYTRRVNEKTDVYSFGVILLELATGREAHDGDEGTCLAEWALRHVQEGNPIADVLDGKIKEPCYLQEMTSVFKLGIFCTRKQPYTRPCMKKVLQFLLLCNPAMVHEDKNEDNALQTTF